jgi:hypothetical protein
MFAMIDAGTLKAVAIGHKGLNTLMPYISWANVGATYVADKKHAIVSDINIFFINPPSFLNFRIVRYNAPLTTTLTSILQLCLFIEYLMLHPRDRNRQRPLPELIDK